MTRADNFKLCLILMKMGYSGRNLEAMAEAAPPFFSSVRTKTYLKQGQMRLS